MAYLDRLEEKRATALERAKTGDYVVAKVYAEQCLRAVERSQFYHEISLRHAQDRALRLLDAFSEKYDEYVEDIVRYGNVNVGDYSISIEKLE